MPSVLVIDDEPRITEFVARALATNGLAVECARDGASGVARALRDDFDLVVLDLMMPEMSGFGVLRALMQAEPRQRVLVLSALSDVETKVRCLELGAADYLVKPFALAELVARVWARVRDHGSAAGFVHAGSMTLDLRRRTVDLGAGAIDLSEREFILLAHLAQHAGATCSRAELLAEVWGYDFDPGTNVVEVCIRRLRAKLGHDTIETVRHAGYRIPALRAVA
jgi:DNA-binding response OmpR family regulator